MASSNQDLKTLLAQGNLEQALETLVRLTEHTNDSDLRQRVLTLSGQFAQLKNQYLTGLLDDKDYRLQWNRIAAAVAEIADNQQLSESFQLSESPSSTQVNWKKWAAILAVLASIAAITGYTLRDFFKKTESPPAVQPAAEPSKKDTIVLVAPPASKPSEKPAAGKNKPATAKKEVEVKVEGDIKDSKIIIGDGNQIKQNP